MLSGCNNVTNKFKMMDRDNELHIAVAYRKIEEIKDLIEFNRINGKDSNGETPLHVSASCGRKDVMKLLLNEGAYINSKDDFGNTPLIKAVNYNKIEIVDFLLKNHADHSIKNNLDDTPLMVALGCNNLIIGEILLSVSYLKDITKALNKAFIYDKKEFIKLILNTDLKEVSENFFSNALINALILMKEDNKFEIVKLLLDKGADLNYSKKGDRALHIASEKGYEEIVELLLKRY